MEQINVKNSEINTIEYDEIASYNNDSPTRSLSDVTKNVDEVVDFCERYGIDSSDGVIQIYASYLCLERDVISNFAELI